jgi:hypothetical protein
MPVQGSFVHVNVPRGYQSVSVLLPQIRVKNCSEFSLSRHWLAGVSSYLGDDLEGDMLVTVGLSL